MPDPPPVMRMVFPVIFMNAVPPQVVVGVEGESYQAR
jgi:hypothetical protein